MGAGSPARPTKRERTFAALVEAGLDLFERQGYEATTVAQIARAAGVTEMTFFRYFPAKEHLLLDDPYDPVLTAAIGEQPRDLAPFTRAARGIRAAWRALPEPETPVIRRRVRIAANTPALRGAVWRSTGNTEQAIIEQLVADGATPQVARGGGGVRTGEAGRRPVRMGRRRARHPRRRDRTGARRDRGRDMTAHDGVPPQLEGRGLVRQLPRRGRAARHRPQRRHGRDPRDRRTQRRG